MNASERPSTIILNDPSNLEMESITDSDETDKPQFVDQPTETKKNVSKQILGIFCLLGVVVMWVGSSILMQVSHASFFILNL